MKLEDCEYCGKRHQPGSLNQQMCQAYHVFSNMEMESFSEEGTREKEPWPDIIFWASIRDRILKRDNYRCTHIGCQNVADEVHHIIPRWAGGHSHPRNLRSLCYGHHVEIHKRLGGGFRPNNLSRDIITGKQLTIDS